MPCRCDWITRLRPDACALPGAIWVAAITARPLCFAGVPSQKGLPDAPSRERLDLPESPPGPSLWHRQQLLPFASPTALLAGTQKLGGGDPKAIRHLPESAHADIAFAALQVAEVVGAEVGIFAERFEGQTALHPLLPNRGAENFVSGTERRHARHPF